jgi:hypothetical protein
MLDSLFGFGQLIYNLGQCWTSGKDQCWMLS